MDPRILDLARETDLSNVVEVGDCHEWQGTFAQTSPVVYVAGPRCRSVRINVPRLVWAKAGREIRPGRVVYRHCCNDACIRLEHLRCRPRGAHLAHRGRMGLAKHRADTIAAQARAARRRTTTTAEMVAAVRELIAQGVTRAEAGRRLGMPRRLVSDIANGRRWAVVAPGASVFALGDR